MAGGLARTTAFWPVRPTLKKHSCRERMGRGLRRGGPARSTAPTPSTLL